ncbi:hypothetical protein [Nocardia spumae]|uniref:hypothetical protein n=1 Tax=Nocardia spumae TaxID=2887190 RepID=UPI001D13B074|nr:hypothetical protein [Nocardia spumae]
MSEPSRMGYLHGSDGISVVDTTGWCHELDDAADLLDEDTPALNVLTIDVDPESVTDREAGQRELEN